MPGAESGMRDVERRTPDAHSIEGRAMGRRLADRAAAVIGGGQQPGETIGNGRAAAILFAREGARVLVVDRDREAAADTVRAIEAEGGRAAAFEADATREADCEAAVAACVERYGGIDVLHNNVGRSQGDREASALGADMWDELHEINVKSYFLCAKHAVAPMRARGGGAIINVSSVASTVVSPTVAYKTSKAAVNALTHQLALENAPYGIRVNAILPGLMDTPMAIERRAREWNVSRREVRAQRDARVPLGRKMGTGWDVGHAAVFLASDEARFITGVLLPVDGGQSINTP